jgi:hypothetical protein
MIEYYRDVNYEALESKNGDKVIKPSAVILQDLILKKEKFGELSLEEEKKYEMLEKI